MSPPGHAHARACSPRKTVRNEPGASCAGRTCGCTGRVKDVKCPTSDHHHRAPRASLRTEPARPSAPPQLTIQPMDWCEHDPRLSSAPPQACTKQPQDGSPLAAAPETQKPWVSRPAPEAQPSSAPPHNTIQANIGTPPATVSDPTHIQGGALHGSTSTDHTNRAAILAPEPSESPPNRVKPDHTESHEPSRTKYAPNRSDIGPSPPSPRRHGRRRLTLVSEDQAPSTVCKGPWATPHKVTSDIPKAQATKCPTSDNVRDKSIGQGLSLSGS